MIGKPDFEVKALAYHLFSEIGMKKPGSEVLILSLCSILKDFMSIKNFVRLTAFKAATSVYSKSIAEFVDDMISKAAKDKSALLRKAASTSVLKVVAGH